MFVITGGGSGIGRALAVALVARQHQVLIVGRQEQRLKEVASKDIDYLVADVSTEAGRNAVANAVKSHSRLDGLIHNAGTLDPRLPLTEITPEQWHQTLNTNLDPALFLTQRLYDQLHHARVLHIGSGAAYIATQGWAAYCVSKAALAMLTRCWQLESSELAFASVMPGIVDTDMQALARMGQHMDPEKVDFFKRLKSANRLLSVETVALFLSWLLLDLDTATYSSKEWDIYDESHHSAWLIPPHQVLHWDFA
jgi:benzil reductase ((S)-benzoin forming)